MNVQRKVSRTAAGRTTVTITVTSDDGIKATYAQLTTQSKIGETARYATKHALAGLKQLTDERQEPEEIA